MATATVKKPVLILELTDRSKSGFILEGSTSDGKPIHLDAPGWRKVPSESVIVGPDGNYRKIRHIQGAKSIFVDEQDKQGYKFSAQRDNIVFKGAVNTIIREGKDVNKFDYLAACEYNWHAENRVNEDKSINIIFKEIRTEEIATGGVSHLKFEKKVNDIIDGLYSEQEGNIVYDEPRMRAISRALGIQSEHADSVMLMAIVAVGKKNPQRFLASIADLTVDYRESIKEAIHLSVLSVDGPGASFVNNKIIFYKFQKKNTTDRIEELVMYFLSPDGVIDYRTLGAELAAARARLAEPA